ncbi:hypothetical protein ACL1G7_13200 [Corynebacterium striatum]
MPVNNKVLVLSNAHLSCYASGAPVLSQQLTSLKLIPSVSEGDTFTFINGDVGEATPTYTWKLEADVIQNLTSSGVVGWMWQNVGKVHNWMLRASSTGDDYGMFRFSARIDPPTVGGAVGKADTTSISLTVFNLKFTPGQKANPLLP